MPRSTSIIFALGLTSLLYPPLVGNAEITAIEGACEHASSAIEVHVQGVRSDRGYVTFVLYNDKPEDFLVKGKKIFKQHFTARKGTVAFCVVLPDAGTYAATAYHDENGNRKFDKNWIGIPVEGFGVSNNPKTFLAPPSHEQAAFAVSHGRTSVDILLKY